MKTWKTHVINKNGVKLQRWEWSILTKAAAEKWKGLYSSWYSYGDSDSHRVKPSLLATAGKSRPGKRTRKKKTELVDVDVQPPSKRAQRDEKSKDADESYSSQQLYLERFRQCCQILPCVRLLMTEAENRNYAIVSEYPSSSVASAALSVRVKLLLSTPWLFT